MTKPKFSLPLQFVIARKRCRLWCLVFLAFEFRCFDAQCLELGVSELGTVHGVWFFQCLVFLEFAWYKSLALGVFSVFGA